MKKKVLCLALVLLLLCAAGAWAQEAFAWRQYQLTVQKAEYDAEGKLCVFIKSEPAVSAWRLGQDKASFSLLSEDGENYAPDGVIFTAEELSSGKASGFILVFDVAVSLESCQLQVRDGSGKNARIALGGVPQLLETQEGGAEESREEERRLGVFATVPPAQRTDDEQRNLGVFATVPPANGEADRENSGENSEESGLGVFATVPPQQRVNSEEEKK